MRDRLIVIPKETIHALRVWIPRAADRSETPFAEATCRVAKLLQRERQLQLTRRHRLLALAAIAISLANTAAVVSNIGVPRMLRRHQHATRGRTHVVPRIVLRESHAVLRELIEIRGANLLLPKRTNVAIAQVIREEEDDVGPASRVGASARHHHCECEE
jgi:hypothetical protein